MTTETIKRHPIRGFFYGIVFGLGLALLAIGQGWAALGTLPPAVLLVVGMVIGTLWGLFAPAKKPKGEPPPAPVEVAQVDPAAPVADAPAVDAPVIDAVVPEAPEAAAGTEPDGGADPVPSGDDDA